MGGKKKQKRQLKNIKELKMKKNPVFSPFSEKSDLQLRNEITIRDCLHVFLWLFPIPIDGVTFKCNQNNLEAKAK